MYFIVTRDEEIIDFAKKRGAQILSTEESIIIEDSSDKVLNDKGGIDEAIIEKFFEGFYYANKETLGYKFVKYILQNNVDCRIKFEKNIYPMLAEKFNVKPRIVRQTMTYFMNNCRNNIKFGMPEDFRKFYIKNIEYRREVERDSNIAFIRLCKRYLESNA